MRYKVEGTTDEWVTVATTRPETILGDTAVCFHPTDERYAHLIGKRVLIPLLKKSIPLIQDEYVDPAFGTGCLKITPAHDINDYTIGMKHNLESIDIFNDNGTLNEKAKLYVGQDRFAVRTHIVQDLLNHGHIEKIEDYTNNVGFSERTDEVIEPKLSVQWFLKMADMAKPALDVVMNDIIHFHPEKFKNTYRHWMENVRDWCISRQLWWGQRIPAWYLPSGQPIVARTAAEALEKARELTGNVAILEKDLKQDEDVLDTWFSSWLWPISVFDGIRNPDNPDIKYYYPTNDLVTAPEILFFWVARMIMAGLEYQQDIPFKNVYLTGIVRDKQGRKMSKSLGNSPDPLELISKYGADGVRVGMLLTSPAGNDLPFDESLCEQGRNFSNKIWNALRLVKGWEVDEKLQQPDYAALSIAWFGERFNETMTLIEGHFSKYRLSDALMAAYKLVWDDFCSWYLEMIKPGYQQPIDFITLEATVGYFEKLMLVLHPFMPFITEEIWQLLQTRTDGESIVVCQMPGAERFDQNMLDQFDHAAQVVNAIRNHRKEKNLPLKEPLELLMKSGEVGHKFDPVIFKLANLSAITSVMEHPDACTGFIVNATEYFIPRSGTHDVEAEREKLQKELDYTLGFLDSVMRKLGNEKFVANAKPEIIENERKKQADAQIRIELLESQLNSL